LPASGKLKYEVFQRGYPKSLFKMIDEWDEEDEYTSMIIACISDIKVHEYKNFQHWINRGLRKRKMGYIKVITFHPDDDFEVEGVTTRSPAPYFLINVAYVDELNKSHQNLKNTKYYDSFTDENKKYLKVEKP